MIKNKSKAVMLFADMNNNIYDYPNIEAVFRSGYRFVRADEDELIKLPYGSYMFMLPDRFPISLTNSGFKSIKKTSAGESINAVSAFLASGYLRTLLPAFEKSGNPVTLPLWAYCGAAFANDEFHVPAMRIDDDKRSDPYIHEDYETLRREIKNTKRQFPDNRLVEQLSICAIEYNCLCARNFFIGRYECPVPTSPVCNAECLGCLSFQKEESPFSQSQFRLEFFPTVDEISQIIVHHLERVDFAVASFGQGCEGEPLLRGDDLAESIIKVRDKTDRGTINLNTNGSMPDAVKKMIGAGLNSIRVSLNSTTEKHYMSYHRPVNYSYNDVIKTIEIALEKKIFVSINLFFMPGFTDSLSEVESLINFLDKYPVSMIQTRNMNIDPDYYFEKTGFKDEDSIGIRNLINMLREKYKNIRLGYYNPPLKT
ncbi:MAG: radical SAM protein [Leptospirales bacterium]|nr:radical SAM protein [Leptospirales bacterium]